MRRSRWDGVWFAAAVALLAAGIVGWWRGGAIPSAEGTSGGMMIAVWASGAIILFAWWRRGAAPDAFDAPLMGPLALAASGPLSLLPVVQGSLVPDALMGAVTVMASVPLGWMLAGLLGDGGSRRWARASIVVGVGISAVAGVLGDPLSYPGGVADLQASLARWLGQAAVSFVPAAMVAGATLRGHGVGRASAARRLVDSLSVLVVGTAPAVTGLCLLLRDWQALVLPAVAVVVTLLILGRFALQPLAGLAGRAQTQRDRVVAAAEAERMRLASVLHDGPLADLTLLIQRLDGRGDAGSAAVARSIATELRAIGSELWLPILDDLGTGPALEWLVGRLSSRSGVPITLDQRTLARPPAAIELAMYRVAQEALVNALKHGLPPIRVGYRASALGAELRVDDAGPGIPPDAAARAERDGRLGLASMAQRADTTGARLTVGVRPDGGTRVELTWRGPVPMAGPVDTTPAHPVAVGIARAGS
jgi:signal transduction histidine kinase